jgi:CrcB protein
MSANGFVAVGMGAGLGAWLRWWLGILFNPVFPTLPLGTLAANLLGGFLMGLAMEFLARHTALSPELRLGITTGFLGGLTTFSTFSAETVTLLAHEEYFWAAVAVTVHVIGSLSMTVLGIFTLRFLLIRGMP